MTVPGRAKSVRRNRRSASQMIVAGLVVLAVAASLLLIFSESVQLLRVGLVIALWAATLGAIAMTKYRRESALDKAKVRDLQKVYELQLEREISARREYELGVEARVRGELGAEAETMKALREELAALRRNLEVLFDGRLPEDRVALRAESTRVQELAGSYQPAASGLFVPGAQKSARDQSRQPAPQGPGFANPYDDPVTAETTVIPPIDVEAVDAAEAEAPAKAPEPVRAKTPAPAKAPEPVRVTAPTKAPTPGKAPAPAKEAPRVQAPAPAREAAPAKTPVPVVQEAPVGAPDQVVESDAQAGDSRPAPRRSRRLAEDAEDSGGAHSNGLSVAEIMANLESANSGDGEPRRRRRAE
ncbi:hypothetical protein EGT67_18465 [Prescottella agglutinans]|uniref:DUF6779 domain-containing protein n=1 Tax=Prescottella agglutinans TaxID=1644129 RepID=A0A3S3ADX3_9NOCA|nr:DUF6779 domain-containing protein [Prescottella agglutinans]RVW07925.1 hypothetical protein EGT67_18465 [Prescottella agglutinans]